MSTLRELLRRGAGMLEEAGIPDAMHDASVLLSSLTGQEPLALRALGDQEASPETEAAFMPLIALRRNREPLQYIVGETPFMGRMILCRPGVLIPRFDTEVLCRLALERLAGTEKVLDLCTGSGALAVEIACRYPEARVTAADISPDALALAEANAARYGARIRLLQGDLYEPAAEETFDMIVSNPPYIPRGELAGLQQEVLREPALALDGGEDGLDFYRRIISGAAAHLEKGGWLLLEIGCSQAQAVTGLMREAGFTDIGVYPDLNGLDRAVAGRRPEWAT